MIYCYSVWQKYLSSDDLPKVVDLCGTDVSLAHKSYLLKMNIVDLVDNKPFLENLVRKVFLMCFCFFA